METFGILFFFGCVILAMALCLIHENKTVKRFWKWRDDLLSAIQTISREQNVIVVTADDFEKIKELENKVNEN